MSSFYDNPCILLFLGRYDQRTNLWETTIAYKY